VTNLSACLDDAGIESCGFRIDNPIDKSTNHYFRHRCCLIIGKREIAKRESTNVFTEIRLHFQVHRLAWLQKSRGKHDLISPRRRSRSYANDLDSRGGRVDQSAAYLQIGQWKHNARIDCLRIHDNRAFLRGVLSEGRSGVEHEQSWQPKQTEPPTDQFEHHQSLH